MDVQQEQHQGVRACDTEGARIRRVSRDAERSELEDLVETHDRGRDRDEDDHRSRDVPLHASEQQVEGHREEHEHRRLQQVREHADAHEVGVRCDLRGGRRGIARGVHQRTHVREREAAEDADDQVQDTRDSRQALRCRRDRSRKRRACQRRPGHHGVLYDCHWRPPLCAVACSSWVPKSADSGHLRPYGQSLQMASNHPWGKEDDETVALGRYLLMRATTYTNVPAGIASMRMRARR